LSNHRRRHPRHEPAREHRGEWDKAGRADANDRRRQRPMPCMTHEECDMEPCIYRPYEP